MPSARPVHDRGCPVVPASRPPRARRAPAWRALALALVALAGPLLPLGAQNVISVPFTNGFVGTRGSSAGTANAVHTYATLGIARAFFIQYSSTNAFEIQGNDIPGTLRLVRTDGTTLDVPASANWRNSGGTTYLIGILPRPASPITLAYPGGTIQLTDGSAPGGTSIGGYVAAYAGTRLADGESTSGNAAASQVLGGLNTYLATVVTSRPAGPVTVTPQTTSGTTPTLAGTATVGAGEQLTVVVAGVQYGPATSPAVVRAGTAWSLALATPLPVGTHAVTATITNADGFTLSDETTDELVVTPVGGTLTLGGTLAAHDRVYDGTVAATGTTTGLALVGVQPGHDVAIAGVTLAFATPAVGAAKPVAITAVTLAGADAAAYGVNLAGAPTATAAVTVRPLTIGGITPLDRPYDGGTAIALGGTPAAIVATPAAGVGKPVTVAGYLPPSANYALTPPAGLTVAVTPRPLTIAGSFTAADRPFDGTTTATIASSALTLAGAVGGDAVTLTGLAAAFADATVGAAKPVALSAASLAGAAAANYALSLAGAPTTTASITALGGTLTLGGTLAAHDRVYDGTVAATGTTTGLALVGVQPGHDVAIAGVTLAFATPAVGAAKPVAVTAVALAGADAAAYTVSLAGAPTATASITARPLTIGGAFTVADRLEDGTAAAAVATSTLAPVGVVAGETVTLAGVAAAFADPAPGAAKPVALTAAALAGADAASYTLSLAGAPTATASILAAEPPSAPRDVAATPGDASVVVAWAPPAAPGCAAITGHLVEYSTDDGALWTRVAPLPASPLAATLAGLANNVAHRVRVAAVNACGAGPFSAPAAPVVPLAPTRDHTGQPPTSPPGTAAGSAGGTPLPVTLAVVEDTTLRLAGDGFALQLRTTDGLGAPIPIDATRILPLEQGGRAAAEGSGFAPGTVVATYLFAAGGTPMLLGTAAVGADGAFAATHPVPDTLAAGDYTLQVTGVDRAAQPRAVGLGVEVVPPLADLVLDAALDHGVPAVGDTITITITVTNAGRGPATDVVIPRAFREPGFAIVATSPLEGRYDAATETWTIPHIASGGRARMLLSVLVLPPVLPAVVPPVVPPVVPQESQP